MDYKGTGERLRLGELAQIAKEFNLEEAHLKTVIEVETSGKGFDSLGWVAFLFEPHKFYVNVSKSKQAEAIKQGLAYPTWRGPGSYPKTPQLRTAQFLKAAKLDETAAIKSASWGLGQIMGSECLEAGYPSPQAMLEAFKESEGNQVRGMCNLIRHRKLDVQLRRFPDMAACRQFALRYNGKAYEKNKYHIKLQDAYNRNKGKYQAKVTLDPMADGVLTYGEFDTEKVGGPIYRMQQAFKNKGYSLLVDGKFGNGTRTTILAWKANNDLPTDSSDMTQTEIDFIPDSKDMEVATERATATAEDIKPQSTIVQTTSLGQKIMGWFGLGTASAAGLSQSGALNSAQDALYQAKEVKGVAETALDTVGLGAIDFLHLVYEWRFIILLVVCGIAFYYFRFIQHKRVEMHQKAEIA